MTYIGVSPSNGVRRVHTYTATGSQTTFTGASSEGITLSYTDANFMDVYQNGVLLAPADYTATSGTSIVLAEGAASSDIVTITVYDAFSVADTVSKSAGGTFDGNVAMAGTLGVTGVLTGTSLDISGNIDVDGTTNLDVTDIDGTLNVAGETTLQTHLNLGDNDKIKLGAGSDLEIYHDASNSYVKDAGTGSLVIEGANVQIQDTQQDLLAKFNNAGAVQLYHVDSGTSNVKLATNTAGVAVTGNVIATSVDNQGARIERNGTTGGANIDSVLPGGSLHFRTGTTERMRINSSGNIGVGTSSPADVRLSLFSGGSGTAGQLKLGYDNSNMFQIGRLDPVGTGSGNFQIKPNGGTSVFDITSAGNVGIGTASPGQLLEINGASNPAVLIKDTTNNCITYMYSQDSVATMGSASNHPVVFNVNNGEKMRIHTGGQVSIATTNATHGLNVGQSGTDFRGRFQGNNQYRLGLQSGTAGLVWLGSGGADNFRVSNSSGSTRFEVEANGYMKVSQQARVMFQGNSNGNTNIASGEIFGATNDGNPAFNTGASFCQAVGITYTSATGRFTVPTAGRYLIHFQAYYNAGAASCRIATYINTVQVNLAHDASIIGTLHLNFVANMSANDYIDFRQISGGTQAWYMGIAHMAGHIILLN